MDAPAPPRRPRVLLGVTGSVAAVKWEELALLLLAWADVRVVHTRAALHFAALSAEYAPAAAAAWAAAAGAAGAAAGAASAARLPPAGARVAALGDTAEWGSYARVGGGADESAVVHIELRGWADALLIAPASAHTLGKLAGGLADNLLTCAARAWPFAADARVAKPFLVAPAMNTAMWSHPATAAHLGTLRAWGVRVVDPVEKRLACGDVGVGALAPCADIDAALRAALGVPPAAPGAG
jgi:phosphopantothenoylcysteine decarboxylase